MFASVNTLAVYVSDKERARRFYCDTLGFLLAVDLSPTLCFLRSPNGKIHIYLEGGMKPSAVDPATARLSFFLQSDQPAQQTYDSLKDAGAQLLQAAPQPVDDETACFQLLDPDGNILEICATL